MKKKKQREKRNEEGSYLTITTFSQTSDSKLANGPEQARNGRENGKEYILSCSNRAQRRVLEREYSLSTR
jgi:hypothetical protein